MRTGERRSRRRSSAGTTVSGWRWWRTVRWTRPEIRTCAEKTVSPTLGVETSWSELSSSTAPVHHTQRLTLYPGQFVEKRGDVCDMFVSFHPDGIISADGAISPELYSDLQNGEPGRSGYLSR